MNISTSLSENIKKIKELLPIGKSFDIITRDFEIRGTKVFFIGLNGLINQEILQKILTSMQNDRNETPITSLQDYANEKIGYGQVTLESNWDTILTNVLSGPCALLFDGFSQAVLIDVRTYPVRSIDEPENEKVLKGSKDGFVETMLFNANLIRRRIRSRGLTFEIMQIGSHSKTDVSIAYDNTLADPDFVQAVKDKLNAVKSTSLTMGSKSMEELLCPAKWYHPLPRTFRTERPDVAASYLNEGYVLLLVDTTPSVIVLPCNIFQFTQNPEDYYKSPLIGTYIRMFRFICAVLALFLLPLFLLFSTVPGLLPPGIDLMPTSDISGIRIFIYVMFAELLLDLFKYSSSHSPNGLSGSLSIVGGLLIGDVAVKLNWASTEIIFYAAATMLASLSVGNAEFSDAIRMYRLMLLLLTGFFFLPGFIIGCGLILLSVFTTPGYLGKSYFWPLFPFQWKALKPLLFRRSTLSSQPEKIWHKK